jgi:hypothetical protein
MLEWRLGHARVRLVVDQVVVHPVVAVVCGEYFGVATKPRVPSCCGRKHEPGPLLLILV